MQNIENVMWMASMIPVFGLSLMLLTMFIAYKVNLYS